MPTVCQSLVTTPGRDDSQFTTLNRVGLEVLILPTFRLYGEFEAILTLYMHVFHTHQHYNIYVLLERV